MDAEGIVHEVCYKVLARKKNSVIQDLDGYIVVSIKNTCLKKVKKQQEVKTVDIYNIPEIKLIVGENEVISFDDRMEKLNKAISELPSSSKEIFKLCVIEGKKYTAVAYQTNLSVNTIKYHVKKCFKILRLKLVNG